MNRGGEAELVDGDGNTIATSGPTSCDAGNYTFDVAPGQTVYLCLGESGSADTTALWDVSAEAMGAAATADELADGGLFRLKADKSGPGGSLLKIKQYGEKSLGDSPRSSWLRIEIAESEAVEEQKAVADLTFSARKESSTFETGDYALLRLTLWIASEEASGGDADLEAGDGVVYKPVANDKNTAEWEGIASVSFSASDDADKFYAKLSTKADPEIYKLYGDPADADLYFRDFTGALAADSTSRATLVLYNPWEDEDYQPDPDSCHIYQVAADSSLSDITGIFTYLAHDEDGNEVNGWRTRTRTLGRYVISDVELDLSAAPGPAPEIPEISVNANRKAIPNTGLGELSRKFPQEPLKAFGSGGARRFAARAVRAAAFLGPSTAPPHGSRMWGGRAAGLIKVFGRFLQKAQNDRPA